MMKIFSALILTLLLPFSTFVAGQSKPTTDLLKPYTKCKVGGGLSVTEVDRYVMSSQKYREVTVAKGHEKVSFLDGYHVLFAFENLPYDFANVKIEQADPASYLHDKETIVSSLKHLSTSDQATPITFTNNKAVLSGFDHYGIDRDRIDVGEVVGTHVLFYDPRQLVVTVYFLNQNDRRSSRNIGNRRRFKNIEEYGVLRDRFLADYSQCLMKVAASPAVDKPSRTSSNPWLLRPITRGAIVTLVRPYVSPFVSPKN